MYIGTTSVIQQLVLIKQLAHAEIHMLFIDVFIRHNLASNLINGYWDRWQKGWPHADVKGYLKGNESREIAKPKVRSSSEPWLLKSRGENWLWKEDVSEIKEDWI